MGFDELSYKIIGFCLNIHKKLKSGFPEKVYHRALELEFKYYNINYISEFNIPIYYHNELISNRRVDFFIEDKIMLEIKAVKILEIKHIVQILNYIESNNILIALLINFGSSRLEIKRIYNKKL